jgi:hypothetical protein
MTCYGVFFHRYAHTVHANKEMPKAPKCSHFLNSITPAVHVLQNAPIFYKILYRSFTTSTLQHADRSTLAVIRPWTLYSSCILALI